jgi:hypothetical protein
MDAHWLVICVQRVFVRLELVHPQDRVWRNKKIARASNPLQEIDWCGQNILGNVAFNMIIRFLSILAKTGKNRQCSIETESQIFSPQRRRDRRVLYVFLSVLRASAVSL